MWSKNWQNWKRKQANPQVQLRFQYSFPVTDRTNKQKINKDRELNNTINQQDLINIYRSLHPKTVENTFQVSMEHIQVPREVTEINNRKTIEKFPNTCELNGTLLNNSWSKQKVWRKIKKKYIELNENDITTYQNLWDTAKAVLTGKCTALYIHYTHNCIH